MPIQPPPPPEVAAVEVFAPRLPPSPGESAFSTVNIDADALRRAPRLDVALRQAPGVSLFRRTGSEAANPTIQGVSLRAIAPSGAGRALVTLDGAPQNDPFGGWVIWSSLPPEGLESAAIVRGAGAGPYGAGALTGVVALRERRIAPGLAGLDLSAGERGGLRAAAVLGGDHLLLTAAAERSDGYIPVSDAVRGGADRPTFLDARSMALRLQGSRDGLDVALRISGYREARGAGLAGAESLARGASAVLTAARSTDRAGWRLQGWVRRSDLANTSVSVAPDRSATSPANNQYETPATGWGFNGAWRAAAGPWTLEIGGDARAAEGEVRELFRAQGGAFTRGRIAGGGTQVAGVYTEVVHSREALVVTGAARLDAWRQADAVRRERDLSTGALLLDARQEDTSGVLPTARLGFRWQEDGLFLRGAAYAGFRAPTLNELHRPFRVGNDITEANAALEPERLVGAELGIGGEGLVDWSVGAFFNRLNDPITNVTVGVGPGAFPLAGFVPAGGVLRRRQNAGRIDAVGVEAELRTQVGAAELRLAGQATRAEVDGGASAPQLTGKRPAQTPVVTLTAGVGLPLAERLRLDADLRYESERYEDDLNTRKLAAGAGLDLRLSYRVREALEFYVAAENLADAEVEVGETADGVESYAAPATLRVGVSLRR